MIENILTFTWIVIFVAALILSVISIFRWLGNSEKRSKRLNILGFCSFVILILMILTSQWDNILIPSNQLTGINQITTESLINVCKIIIKIFFICTLTAFALLLTISILMFAFYGLWTIWRTARSLLSQKEGTDNIQDELIVKEEKLVSLVNNRLFIIIFTGGILAIFFVIPLVVGDGSCGVIKCWQDGIEKIAVFAQSQETPNVYFEDTGKPFPAALSLYMLIYIAILGIGFAAFNIIYEIIKNIFKQRDNESFWGQYSNPIGLLTVGISLLLMISTNRFNFPEDGKWVTFIANMLPPFIMVIVIVALGILSLEIVRLLLDIKETLIRNEARYLFVLLIGQCTIIICRVLTTIYEALSSVLTENKTSHGSTTDRMDEISDQIIIQVADDIAAAIKNVPKKEPKDTDEIPYRCFTQKTMKKPMK